MDYVREFRLTMAKVDDRAPEEAHRLLMKHLPAYWRKRILREEARSSALRPWAKITKSRLLTENHVRRFLREKGIRFHHVVQGVNGTFEVECKNGRERLMLLDLDHIQVAGGPISICKHKRPMDWEELISLMNE